MTITMINDNNITALSNEVSELTQALRDVVNSKEKTEKDIFDANNKVQAKVQELNNKLTDRAFGHWLSEDEPMFAFLNDAFVPFTTVTMSEKTDRKTKTKSTKIDRTDSQRLANIVEFVAYARDNNKKCPCKSQLWLNDFENARKAIVGYWVGEFGLNKVEFDKTNGYLSGEKMAEKYTKGNIDRKLQALMDAIIYDDKTDGGKSAYIVKSTDRNKFLATMTTADKTKIGAVKFLNAQKFGELVTSYFGAIVQAVSTEYIYK